VVKLKTSSTQYKVFHSVVNHQC